MRADPSALMAELLEGSEESRRVGLTTDGAGAVGVILKARGLPIGDDPPADVCAPATALVSEFNGGAVLEVDLGSGAVTPLADGLLGPRSIVLDASGTTAYVTVFTGQLVAIDRATGTAYNPTFTSSTVPTDVSIAAGDFTYTGFVWSV